MKGELCKRVKQEEGERVGEKRKSGVESRGERKTVEGEERG